MLQVVDGPVAPKIHCGTEGTEGGTSREHFRGGAPYPGRLKRYGRRACGRESDAAGRKVRHAERRDVRARSEREGDGERHPLRAAPLRAAAGRQSRGSCCSPAAPHHSWRPPCRCRQPCSAQVMRTPCPARGEPGRAEQREGQRERERERQVGVRRDEAFGMDAAGGKTSLLAGIPKRRNAVCVQRGGRENFALHCDDLEGGKERSRKLHRAGENPSAGSAVRHTEREEGSGIRGGGEERGTA